MSIMKVFCFFYGLLSMMASYGHSPLVVYYEPAVISVDGVLETHIFPGPPNYENIVEGDKPEKCFYLRLDRMINDVIPDPKETYSWEAERDIEIMQLSLRARPELFGNGDHVRLTGSLYQGFNAHHHTRVLMSVDKVEVLIRAKGQVLPPLEELRDGMLE